MVILKELSALVNEGNIPYNVNATMPEKKKYILFEKRINLVGLVEFCRDTKENREYLKNNSSTLRTLHTTDDRVEILEIGKINREKQDRWTETAKFI